MAKLTSTQRATIPLSQFGMAKKFNKGSLPAQIKPVVKPVVKAQVIKKPMVMVTAKKK